MQFSTTIKLEQEADITYASKIMMFGSCFSEHIGNKLDSLKFNVSNNPLGILFNPCSILETIRRIAEKRNFTEQDLFCTEGIWNSFHLHSKFAQLNAVDYLNNANTQLAAAHTFLQNATHLFITLGTAWIYELAEDGTIVANCHKEKKERFIRKRLSLNECADALRKIIQTVQGVNPSIIITFTVSPIRHWKDGAHGNQISKSTLLLAIEMIQEKNPSVQYFPAYEIMMDELRDYRFYASDLLHPNEMAINYLWERFSESRISPQTQEEMNLVERLISAINHRPFNPGSESYRKFQTKTLELIGEMEKKLPQLNWDTEKSRWGE